MIFERNTVNLPYQPGAILILVANKTRASGSELKLAELLRPSLPFSINTCPDCRLLAFHQSFIYIYCEGEQQRPWSDCANAQPDQGFRCSQDPFYAFQVPSFAIQHHDKMSRRRASNNVGDKTILIGTIVGLKNAFI